MDRPPESLPVLSPTGALDTDTIAAIATAPGAGGIGVIRLSGPDALPIAKGVCGAIDRPRFAHYRQFYDVDGSVIDDGLCLYFPGPSSFTGEDVVELQGHGGTVVLQMLLQRVIDLGARQARPGEFSERAFLNDRLDLAQAEAVADLIAAQTQTAVRQARATLRGVFSEAIDQLATALVSLRIYVEAAIDFPEEEIDFLADGHVTAQLQALIDQTQSLLKKARGGVLMQTGATVVLAGRPNAGKSSLMNRLAEEELTIVTPIPGTTRDVIRETIQINGLPIRLVDTAGLREATDLVEAEGVRRANREIGNADLVLHLVDDSDNQPPGEPDTDAIVITVLTKCDLSGRAAGRVAAQTIAISSVTGAGLNDLKDCLCEALGMQGQGENAFSARERHLVILREVLQQLTASSDAFQNTGAGELLAEDLRRCHEHLGAITGRMTSDQLLGEIFSSFCIGK